MWEVLPLRCSWYIAATSPVNKKHNCLPHEFIICIKDSLLINTRVIIKPLIMRVIKQHCLELQKENCGKITLLTWFMGFFSYSSHHTFMIWTRKLCFLWWAKWKMKKAMKSSKGSYLLQEKFFIFSFFFVENLPWVNMVLNVSVMKIEGESSGGLHVFFTEACQVQWSRNSPKFTRGQPCRKWKIIQTTVRFNFLRILSRLYISSSFDDTWNSPFKHSRSIKFALIPLEFHS
jgi:hypothetical protein